MRCYREGGCGGDVETIAVDKDIGLALMFN
jgi:hypothetical protein